MTAPFPFEDFSDPTESNRRIAREAIYASIQAEPGLTDIRLVSAALLTLPSYGLISSLKRLALIRWIEILLSTQPENDPEVQLAHILLVNIKSRIKS